MASEDLLAYLKLEAEVFDDHTIHQSHRRSRTTGVIERVETKWIRVGALGYGAFGQVWLEQDCPSDGRQRARAVKIIQKEQMRRLGVDYRKELLALTTFSKRKYRHANVLVSLLNWFENDNSVFLAMEYFQHGDLASHMAEISSEAEVRQITKDLLEGLKIMHDENFTHRDLKPQNIFVVEKPPQSARWWVKIGDFGISKRVNGEETALRTQIGTLCFQAPEINGCIDCDGRVSEYSKSVDIWSLGCVVYNIAARQMPFPKLSNIVSFCEGRSQLSKEPLSLVLSDSGIEFIERLLVPEPQQRITVNQALQNPWVFSVTTSASGQNLQGNPVAPAQRNAFPERSGTRLPYSADPNTDHTTTYMTSLRCASAVQPGIPIIINTAGNARHSPQADSHSSNAHIRRNPSQQQKPPAPEVSSEVSTITSDRELVIRKPHVERWSQEFSPKAPTSACPLKIALSMDGSLLASLSSHNDVRLWDTATGQIYRQLQAGRSTKFRRATLALSKDGKMLAYAIFSTIKIWNANTGQVIRELDDQTFEPARMVFSPQGTLLASLSRSISKGRTIRMVEIPSGRIRYEINTRFWADKEILFSPDGTLLASIADGVKVQMWNVATGRLYYEIRFHDVLGQRHGNYIHGFAFSPDGKLVALGLTSGKIRLWDMITGNFREFSAEPNPVYIMMFSWDGALLVTGQWSQSCLRVWNVSSGETLCEIEHIEVGKGNKLACSSHGTLFAADIESAGIKLRSITLPRI